MNSPICSAPQCDKPPHNGHLCLSCFETLKRDLNGIPDLLADLEVTITRQDRVSGRSEGRSSDERPLPLRLGPMEARRDLADTLRTWATHLQRASIYLTDVAEVANYASSYIRSNLGRVQIDERAGDLADEIGYAVIMARRTVDKPLAHTYAGPCNECTTSLYAHPRADDVTCEGCGLVYQVAARRIWLLEHVEDQLATATELSRALPNLLQIPLTAAMIRGYARRHGDLLPQKPPHPQDKTRAPRYRVGDLIGLLHAIRNDQALAS